MSFLENPIHIEDLPEQEQGNYDPIPEGNYDVIIKSAGLSPTKDGTGQYIKIRLDVIGPTHAGRVLFSNLNIKNKSAAAENIGRQQLRSIMQAIGISVVNDTDQLIGGTLSVKVGIRAADGQYPSENDIKSYSSTVNSAPPIAVPSQQSTKAAPPWAKQ